MITRPTVFVLGAGASMPYGYPSGEDLVKRCWHGTGASILSGLGADASVVEQFLKALRQSDHSSVDAFLEHRPRFMHVGKLAIAAHLVQCEDQSSLQKDWYAYLLAKMSSPLVKFKDNKVAFITFNYDRSLEQYLYTALCNRFEEAPEAIAEVMRGLSFIHVHGQLGYLPWQNASPSQTRTYSPETQLSNIKIAAMGIKIISEKIDDSPEFAKGRELMAAAEFIFLLGFGYHYVNMRRLALPWGKKIIGTAYGLTVAEKWKLTERDYRGLELGNSDHKVKEFLRESHTFQDSVTNS